MSARKYLLWSLAAPLVLPVVVALLGILSQYVVGSNEATVVTRLAFVLGGSVAIGGIPYILFIGGLLYWSRGKRAVDIWYAILSAPLAFAILFVVLWIPYTLIDLGWDDHTVDNALISATYFGLYCLGFGYAYVAFVNAGYFVLRKLGKIEDLFGGSA